MITLHVKTLSHEFHITRKSILTCLGNAEEVLEQIYDETDILVSHVGFIPFYTMLTHYGRATLVDMTNRRIIEFHITFPQPQTERQCIELQPTTPQ